MGTPGFAPSVTLEDTLGVFTSHDLQEPLRMVSSYFQLLDRRYADLLDDDAREYIEYAVDVANRMRDIIDDLLGYARVETQGEPLDPTVSEAVVDHVLAILEVQIAETDAEIEVESLPSVAADSKQLEQLFQNLVSNAIKYRGDEPPSVEIDAARDGSTWMFRVADNGIGMDPEYTDRIFDVFTRHHTSQEYSGTGIGLALCRRIVERHSGDIWVDTSPGDGTTFFFTMPGVDGSRSTRDGPGMNAGQEGAR